MKKSIIAFFLFMAGAALAASPFHQSTIWDLGGEGRISLDNKSIIMDGNRAVVDLRKTGSRCPRGIGGPGPNRKVITEVTFRYTPPCQQSWLHIAWRTGTSHNGKEQFDVILNGKKVGSSRLVDQASSLGWRVWECFKLKHKPGVNELLLRRVSGDSLLFDCLVLSATQQQPVPVRPFPKTPTLADYEDEIGEDAVQLDDERVRIYSPKRYERESKIVMKYLTKAYNELHRMTGVHTDYKIIVYHFPKEHRYCRGGTSMCTIRYSYRNLEFDKAAEWNKHRMPHVVGYIEEMSHNFVGSARAIFGWEMIGWNICQEVTQKVAGNSVITSRHKRAREVQKERYEKYMSNNGTIPDDIPHNLSDSIHSHLLWKWRKKCGSRFWPAFFGEIGESRRELLQAMYVGPKEEARNTRYQLTVDALDAVTRGQFKKELTKSHISLTHEISQFQARDPKWRRRFD